jgi:putative cardiolipin synthase
VRVVACLVGALAASACTPTVPTNVDLEHSYAIEADQNTTLTAYLAPDSDTPPNASALALLSEHRDALIARLGLIDLSEHSIDLQYYIWKGDTVGGLMLERVLRAADRGVRVRLLLDDYASGKQDVELFVLAAHPNIEVRMYNPFSYGRSGTFGRTLAFFHDFRRLNHRMHNKAFIVDNQAAILGGRNLSDKDFGFSQRMNSRDMDVFVAGPVVADVSESFDTFWNSEWAIQIERLSGFKTSKRRIRRERYSLHSWATELEELPWQLEWDDSRVHAALQGWRESWIWANAKLVVDEPRKDQLRAEERQRDVVRDLLDAGERSRREVVIVAPYLIPSDAMLEHWRKQISDGRRVAILTNSLRANNVAIAQYGYMRWRRRMVEIGVELYELRADAAARERHAARAGDPPPLSLHAKLVVWDAKTVYIGSLNLDPRSLNLNTEIGLLIESPALAKLLMDELDQDLKPENSYRVALDATGTSRSNSRLVWHSEDDGTPVVHGREPGFGIWHKMLSRLFRLLPIEDQL